MVQGILTPEQSKAARAFVGNSQAKVARETGLNRSQLALFEVERYLLPDKIAQVLRDYYEGQGYRFSEEKEAVVRNQITPQRHSEHNLRIEESKTETADDAKVNSYADRGEIEVLRAEITANDKRIMQLAAEKAKEELFGFWGGDYRTEKRDELLQLMALNYSLAQQIQGHETPGLSARQDPKGRTKTNGDLVNELFHAKFEHKETHAPKQVHSGCDTRNNRELNNAR